MRKNTQQRKTQLQFQKGTLSTLLLIISTYTWIHLNNYRKVRAEGNVRTLHSVWHFTNSSPAMVNISQRRQLSRVIIIVTRWRIIVHSACHHRQLLPLVAFVAFERSVRGFSKFEATQRAQRIAWSISLRAVTTIVYASFHSLSLFLLSALNGKSKEGAWWLCV